MMMIIIIIAVAAVMADAAHATGRRSHCVYSTVSWTRRCSTAS